MSLTEFINSINKFNSLKPDNLYKPSILLRNLDKNNSDGSEVEISKVVKMYTEGNTNYFILDKKYIYGCKDNDVFKADKQYTVSFSLDQVPFGYLNYKNTLTANNCNLYPMDDGRFKYENTYLTNVGDGLLDDFFCNYYFSSDASIKQVGNGLYDIEITNPDYINYYQIWHYTTKEMNSKKTICDKIPLIDFVTEINKQDYDKYIDILKNIDPDNYFYQPSVAMLIENNTYFAVIKNMKVNNSHENGNTQTPKVIFRVSIEQTNFVNKPSLKTYLPNGKFKINFDIDYNTMKTIYILKTIQGMVFLGKPADLPKFTAADGSIQINYNGANWPVINSILGIGGEGNDNWPNNRAAITTPMMVQLFENISDQYTAQTQAIVPHIYELKKGDKNSSLQFNSAEGVYILPDELPPGGSYDDVYWMNDKTINWLANTVGINVNFKAIAAIQAACYDETPIKKLGVLLLLLLVHMLGQNMVFIIQKKLLRL